MEAYAVYSFYLPYFTQYNFFEMHPLCCMCEQFLPFLFPEQYSPDCVAATVVCFSLHLLMAIWVVSSF